MPQPINMTPRWIGWIVASAILPVLPWIVLGASTNKDASFPAVLIVLGVAMIAQLIASILVAIGLANQRSMGLGGIIGLSVAFMAASVAIGSGVFFVACLAAASMG
jgi:hypothetical protein